MGKSFTYGNPPPRSWGEAASALKGLKPKKRKGSSLLKRMDQMEAALKEKS